ncbi:MAG: carbon-nitrogen family hydrolase [Candidatus Desulfofervidaceae bacterium]|nr:carbon-nitrogen family hydrolase [Candidatus Desulfofervidaceae bacterium]
MSYKVGIVQFAIQPGKVEENIKHVFHIIENLLQKKTRLIVLPELWATGFDYIKLKELAQAPPLILVRLQRILPEDVIVIGSLPQIKADKVYNTAFITDKKGILVQYHKIHLFTPTGEDKYFTSGKEPVVISSPLGKIGLLVCYDLRFPELARLLTLRGAEVLVICAAWPQARIEHWRILLRARAIENQVFVIAANASGSQNNLKMGGHSAVISPYGEFLAEAGEEEAILQAEVDLDKVYIFRQELSCLQDRQPEVYHGNR